MQNKIYSIINGSGSYIPEKIVHNTDFLSHVFYDSEGKIIEIPNEELIKKFKKITNISERRYLENGYVTSDIAFIAAEKAINSSGIDPETLDYIIVAHNFGDVKADNSRSDIVPSLATRVKNKLRIKNPGTVAYDIIFGCPGWLQGVIQADYYIKSGDAKRVLVVGSEVLSRVSDPHDRDSMIYSDGAGAVIFEGKESDEPVGILSHSARSDTYTYSNLLWMSKSYNPDSSDKEIYLKMNGRKLYEYALSYVPQVVKNCIEKAKLTIDKISKVLIHQANEKMDEAILQRLFALYEKIKIPTGIMPMIIDKLGNSSVATIPILLDLILKGKMDTHELNAGDNIIFASVGAGMNVNAVAYKMA
jgi:3-oxoacyl-[acyl-carrier-protein] synthase-3